jgi:hypothetical protein
MFRKKFEYLGGISLLFFRPFHQFVQNESSFSGRAEPKRPSCGHIPCEVCRRQRFPWTKSIAALLHLNRVRNTHFTAARRAHNSRAARHILTVR